MSAWGDAVVSIIQAYPVGFKFTSDAVRKDALLKAVGLPSHENAWGSVFSKARKLGLIRKTGRYFPSDIPSSNGRVIAEWEKLT